MRKSLELDDNKNTTYPNKWNAGKLVVREKFMALTTCIRKEERAKITVQSIHLKTVEKDQPHKFKESRKKRNF